MTRYLRLTGQFVVILLLFSAVAAFANWPIYRQIPEGHAVVVLTFVHGADRKAECRTRSPAEIAKLAPNMRRLLDCPRGRPAIYVELDLAGKSIYRATLPPSGIASDGNSRVYQRFVVPAGQYQVAVRMRDTPRTEGFDHQRNETVTLVREQMFVVDFRSETGDFIFR